MPYMASHCTIASHFAIVSFSFIIIYSCLNHIPQASQKTEDLRTNLKPRVLLVSHEFSSTGAVGSLLDIRLLLKQEGYHVDFVCLEDDGPNLHTVDSAYSKINHNTIFTSYHEYDIVVANTVVVDKWIVTQMDAFGTDFSEKLIWYVRELPIGYLAETLYLKNNFHLRQRIFDTARAVIFVSNASKVVYNKSFKLDPQRAHVLPNPIGAEFLEKSACFQNNRNQGRSMDHRWKLGIHVQDTMVRQMVVQNQGLMTDDSNLHSGSCYRQI